MCFITPCVCSHSFVLRSVLGFALVLVKFRIGVGLKFEFRIKSRLGVVCD